MVRILTVVFLALLGIVLSAAILLGAAGVQGFFGFGFGILAMVGLTLSHDLVHAAGVVNLTGLLLTGSLALQLRHRLLWPVLRRMLPGVLLGVALVAAFALRVEDLPKVGQSAPRELVVPKSEEEFEKLLGACRDVLGSDCSFTWVGESFLLEQGVRPFVELPFWLPASHASYFANGKGVAAGMVFRPIADTILETADWHFENAGKPGVN